jgi:hypothetical protein
MTRMDINGNTIGNNRASLKRLIRQASTYSVDSVGRVMVDDGKGGMVVFFASDEPELYAWVNEYLEVNRKAQRCQP